MGANSPCKSNLHQHRQAGHHCPSWPSRAQTNTGGSNVPTYGWDSDSCNAVPLWLVVIRGYKVICWQCVKGSRSHLPAGGMAEENKREDRWRAEQIEMRGFHFHFDCSPGVFLSFFLSLSIVLALGLCGELYHQSLSWPILHNLIHWDEWPFLYVEHEVMWNCMQTHCDHTHTHYLRCLFIVWYQADMLFCFHKGIALLVVPDGTVFLFYSFFLSLPVSAFFFHHLFILIQRKPSGLHIKVFYPLPCCCFPSYPLMSLHFVLFTIKIVPLDKRATKAFTDRGGDGFVCNR